MEELEAISWLVTSICLGKWTANEWPYNIIMVENQNTSQTFLEYNLLCYFSHALFLHKSAPKKIFCNFYYMSRLCCTPSHNFGHSPTLNTQRKGLISRWLKILVKGVKKALWSFMIFYDFLWTFTYDFLVTYSHIPWNVTWKYQWTAADMIVYKLRPQSVFWKNSLSTL
mgnify:CR=1 FL=1